MQPTISVARVDELLAQVPEASDASDVFAIADKATDILLPVCMAQAAAGDLEGVGTAAALVRRVDEVCRRALDRFPGDPDREQMLMEMRMWDATSAQALGIAYRFRGMLAESREAWLESANLTAEDEAAADEDERAVYGIMSRRSRQQAALTEAVILIREGNDSQARTVLSRVKSGADALARDARAVFTDEEDESGAALVRETRLVAAATETLYCFTDSRLQRASRHLAPALRQAERAVAVARELLEEQQSQGLPAGLVAYQEAEIHTYEAARFSIASDLDREAERWDSAVDNLYQARDETAEAARCLLVAGGPQAASQHDTIINAASASLDSLLWAIERERELVDRIDELERQVSSLQDSIASRGTPHVNIDIDAHASAVARVDVRLTQQVTDNVRDLLRLLEYADFDSAARDQLRSEGEAVIAAGEKKEAGFLDRARAFAERASQIIGAATDAARPLAPVVAALLKLLA